MAEYTMDDLLALQPRWLETFGDDLAYGFEIMPPQVPMLRQCLREKSKAPLRAFIKTLAGRAY